MRQAVWFKLNNICLKHRVFGQRLLLSLPAHTPFCHQRYPLYNTDSYKDPLFPLREGNNISIHRCHLMTLLGMTSSGSTRFLNSGIPASVHSVTIKDTSTLDSLLFYNCFWCYKAIFCPLQSKRLNWLQFKKSVFQKSRKRKHTQETETPRKKVKSSVRGEHGSPAAVAEQWPRRTACYSFRRESPSRLPLSCCCCC